MERILTYSIKKELENMTAYDFLKSVGFSSQNIISLKKMPQSILVNGEWIYMNHRLKENDVVMVHITENTSSEKIVPIPLSFSIVYEDEDILVINKPAHMPIHPSQNNYENTLANAVAYYYRSQGIPYVFRCINRLDRDTTGLTILAKHMLSANILGTMVQNREIKREYLAIVEGTPNPLNDRIAVPIARVNGSTIEREVNEATGETAITNYKVLKSNDTLSLVSLWLETGRTHQIRVHMKYIGHPLIGDFLYNPNFTQINRQALHSHRLTFLHPITKKPLCFEVPLPDDMCLF